MLPETFSYYASYTPVTGVATTIPRKRPESSRVTPPFVSLVPLSYRTPQNSGIAKMDQGHGLIDRILIVTPIVFRPTLTEMKAAKGFLSTEVENDFEEYFNTIHGLSEQQVQFSFCDIAKQALRGPMDQFVADTNEAIQDGRVPPKSNIPELISRVATALHVFNHSIVELLAGHTPTEPPRLITRSTLESATIFVRHVASQKEILCQVSYNNNK